MFRHVMITLLIVGVVYGALLWVNADLITDERATWEEYSAYVDANETDEAPTLAMGSAGAIAHDRPTSIDDSSRNDKGDSVAYETAERYESTPKKIEKSGNINSTKDSLSLGFSIIGNIVDIDLTHSNVMRSQVEQAWASFNQNSTLHAIVSWEKGINDVFAYYHNFSDDYSHAKLIIGYRTSGVSSDFKSVQIAQGHQTQYELTASGEMPNRVWEEAYPNGAILGHYIVSDKGQSLSGEVWVIK